LKNLAGALRNEVKQGRDLFDEIGEGFDFTGAEFVNWLKEAGFAEMRVEPLVGPDSMVIGVK